MAEAIFSGLIEQENLPRKRYICNKSKRSSQDGGSRKREYGIRTTYNMEELLKDADIIVLAIKPNDAGSALQKVQPFIKSNALIISVIAGISIGFIEEKIKVACAIARAMPNTSASIGKSATAITFNENVSDGQKQLQTRFFQP